MTDYAIMLVSTTSGEDVYRKVTASNTSDAIKKAEASFGKRGSSYHMSVMTKADFMRHIYDHPVWHMLTHAEYELIKGGSFTYGAVDRLRSKYSWKTLPSRLKKVLESVTWSQLQPLPTFSVAR